MKKSELSVIAVIVIVSIVVAYFVGQSLLGSISQKGVTVQTEQKISDAISQPDSTVFYSGAKNPTVPISIGGSSNLQPLSGSQ